MNKFLPFAIYSLVLCSILYSHMDVDLQTEKNVFVVFYAGEKVKAKILKICDAFGANRYPFAEELGKQAQMISEVCILVVISL